MNGKPKVLRVTKTLARIRAAFLKLVSENSYDELTVSALCAEAQVGRKTFYVYYSSLDSLFEEILEEIMRAYLHAIEDYSAPAHIREITRKFYEFSTSQGNYYDNLVCSDSYQRIGTRLMMRLVRGHGAIPAGSPRSRGKGRTSCCVLSPIPGPGFTGNGYFPARPSPSKP